MQHAACRTARRWAEEEYILRQDTVYQSAMSVEVSRSLLGTIIQTRAQAQAAYRVYDLATKELRDFAGIVDFQDCSDFNPYI